MFHQRSLFIIFLTLCCQFLHSQIQITGHVFSAKDSATIAGASIYFDGTSIGTSSDLNGYFKLQLKKAINSDLIISSIGYKAISLKTLPSDKNVKFSIYLDENNETLETVFLEDDPWTRKKKLEYFRREFIGLGPAAEGTTILNEENLVLRYSPSKNKMTAYSDEPLIIKNDYLGYKIKYSLVDFYIDFKENSEMVNSIFYAGTSFFQDLQKIKNRQLKRRKESYFGSSLHFMRSIVHHALSENSFLLYADKKQVTQDEVLELSKTEKYYQASPKIAEFRVRYDQSNWSMVVLEDDFTIDEFGNFYPPTSITLSGAMGSKRVGDMVPLDYQFKE